MEEQQEEIVNNNKDNDSNCNDDAERDRSNRDPITHAHTHTHTRWFGFASAFPPPDLACFPPRFFFLVSPSVLSRYRAEPGQQATTKHNRQLVLSGLWCLVPCPPTCSPSLLHCDALFPFGSHHHNNHHTGYISFSESQTYKQTHQLIHLFHIHRHSPNDDTNQQNTLFIVVNYNENHNRYDGIDENDCNVFPSLVCLTVYALCCQCVGLSGSATAFDTTNRHKASDNVCYILLIIIIVILSFFLFDFGIFPVLIGTSFDSREGRDQHPDNPG